DRRLEPHRNRDRVRELRAEPRAGRPTRAESGRLPVGSLARPLRVLRRFPSRAERRARRRAMIQTLLITWREMLEPSLIVGILLTYLVRSGQRAGIRYVWLGAGAAVLAALACGAVSGGAFTLLDPDTQELLQAGVLFLAVGVLSWMILWMGRHAGAIRGDLH